MQFLPDRRAFGFPQPDTGPVGLPAAPKDPAPEVLPSSQRCLQVLQQRVQGEVHHLDRGNPTDSGLKEQPFCMEAAFANKSFKILL